jgi:hypothetical protein
MVNTSQFDAKPHEVDHWITGVPVVGIGSWIVNTSSTGYPLNIMPLTTVGFKASLTTAWRNAWRFDSNVTACTSIGRCRCKSFAKSGRHGR